MHDEALLERILRTPRHQVPRCAALVGLGEDGTPVLLRLDAVRHVLIACPPAVSALLLRPMALSLAVWNRQRHVQLVLIDPTGHVLSPLAALPHVWGGLCVRREERHAVLEALIGLADRREREGIRWPRMAVFVADDVQADEPALLHLARRGGMAGIHLVLAEEAAPSTAIAPFAPVQISPAGDAFVLKVRGAFTRFHPLGIGGTAIRRWSTRLSRRFLSQRKQSRREEPSREKEPKGAAMRARASRLPRSVEASPPKPWWWAVGPLG